MRILIVEDNPRLARSIEQALTVDGHSCDTVHTGSEAEELAAQGPHDLYLLDVMLPDQSGITVCRNLRHMGIGAPVLILTALTAVDRRVEGLDAGADDYLCKPFEYDELIARVRALLRRRRTAMATTLVVNDIELDVLRRSVKRQGEPIKVTAKEFNLLEFFMRRPERVLSRSSITQEVWETQYDPASNLVDVYVSNLRKKLRSAELGDPIHTVVGTGYRFGEPAHGARV